MRFTIKLKLSLVFGFIVIMTCVMAGMSIYNLSSLNTAIADMVKGPVAELSTSSDLSDLVLRSVGAEKDSILNSDPKKLEGYITEFTRQRDDIGNLVSTLAASSDPEIQSAMAR